MEREEEASRLEAEDHQVVVVAEWEHEAVLEAEGDEDVAGEQNEEEQERRDHQEKKSTPNLSSPTPILRKS